jgi:outer membrane protein assembly factor BamB
MRHQWYLVLPFDTSDAQHEAFAKRTVCWGVTGMRFQCKSGFMILVVMLAVITQSVVVAQEHDHWPQWRGPFGTGVSESSRAPTRWDSNTNVRWKTKVVGRGHSTPIVWGNRVFLTAAAPVGEKLVAKMSGRPGEHDNLPIDSRYQFIVLAFDRDSGAIVWQRVLHEAVPREAGHQTASLASASPVTDGQRLYAHFGSHGLYCMDFDGNVLWDVNFGQMHSKHGHGEGASPCLVGDSLIINWDHEEGSFLVRLDKESGKEIWRSARLVDTSWSSPIAIELAGKTQIIVSGTNVVAGYDLDSGKIIWQCGGMSSNVVATPVYDKGIVYVGSSYEKRILMAIDLRGAEGDITDSERILWSRSRGTPYVPSPLLYKDALYFLTHYQNVLTRIDGPTGTDAPGSMRLGPLGNIYASPVAANGNIYVTDLSGTTLVITADEIPRIVAANPLGEDVNASLAIVHDEVFIRGTEHLFCIGEG